jgi:RNA polymerase sigma-70 factor (ECF subfamily)
VLAPDLDHFFQQHFAIVKAKCARVLGDTEEAADVAQETFLRLCQSPAAREPAAARLKWIYVTGTRLAIDRLRRRRLGVEVKIEGSGSNGSNDRAGGGAVDEALAARQLLARLSAELAPVELEVLVLSRCDRMTQDEIGGVLDLSARHVRRLLVRAESRLADLGLGS